MNDSSYLLVEHQAVLGLSALVYRMVFVRGTEHHPLLFSINFLHCLLIITDLDKLNINLTDTRPVEGTSKFFANSIACGR